MQNYDELALVECAQTDSQAFAVLYDAYVDRIYSYALRLVQDGAVAQDITAVTFEKALRSIRRTQWRGNSFCAWLYRIARNEAMTYHRKRRRLLPWQTVKIEQFSNGTMRGVEAAVALTQTQEQLHHALKQLSAKDQEIISLRFFEALSNDDIADVLNCSTNNVYVRLHRALKRLQTQLENLEIQGVLFDVP